MQRDKGIGILHTKQELKTTKMKKKVTTARQDEGNAQMWALGLSIAFFVVLIGYNVVANGINNF